MTTTNQHNAESNAIIRDLPCVTCGYNLRTLPASAGCPECGRSVRSSLIPPDLRFKSFRAILRTRYGIGLWIAALALPAIGATAFTTVVLLSPVFWDDLSNPLGPFVKMYRLALYAWIYAFDGVLLTHAVAILVITWPFAAKDDPCRTRIGASAFSLALLTAASVIVSGYFDWAGLAAADSWLRGVLVGLVAPFTYAASLCLGWIFLSRLLDQQRGQRLARLMSLTLLGPILEALAVSVRAIFEFAAYWLWFSDDGAHGVLQARLDRAIDVMQTWFNYGGILCSILMIVALWAYQRRLEIVHRGVRARDNTVS